MEFYELPASTQKAIKDTILDHCQETFPALTRTCAMGEGGNITTLEIRGIDTVFGHVTLEKTGKLYLSRLQKARTRRQVVIMSGREVVHFKKNTLHNENLP